MKYLKKVSSVILYIIIVGLNIWAISKSYPQFLITYGDKSFSKGVLGFLICTSGNILLIIVVTIWLVLSIKNNKSK